MSSRCRNLAWLFIGVICVQAFLPSGEAAGADLTSAAVLDSIDRAKRYLVRQQQGDGSWIAGDQDAMRIGVTGLVMLSLLNSGMTAEDPAIQKGLNYLRGVDEPQPDKNYEVALTIMVYAAARDPKRDDMPRILNLAQKLERSQIRTGRGVGGWSYRADADVIGSEGDRSNSQFAVLGLFEAAEAGVPVSREVWERAQRHWLLSQNIDGGWGYSSNLHRESYGSMTVAGIGAISILEHMLRDDSDLNPDGTPRCCEEREPDEAMERALRWMENHFSVAHNPLGDNWLLYYLYGVERAGRLSGRRFFGRHDWYREGARYLLDEQNRRDDSWRGVGSFETHPVVGTSFALLFLSKGLSPVLINKLKYGPRVPGRERDVLGTAWDQHHFDIRNLTQLTSGLPKWPRLVTWQTVDIAQVAQGGSLSDLVQAPVMYISGSEPLVFTAAEKELLKGYIEQGGFILAMNTCNSVEFEESFKALLAEILPNDFSELRPLPSDHLVYRSEYLLDPTTVELWGVDFGCRTAVMYSPDDLACLWDKWARHDPPGRPLATRTMVERAVRVGVNIVAYATGREPPNSLERQNQLIQDGAEDAVHRGLLQIAKVRHNGGWDSAPRALRNLLHALNQTVGLAASTQQRDLPLTDPSIYRYPLLYLHGRTEFTLSDVEREQLRKYLARGGLLMADSCCGSEAFDRSFRREMARLFPEQPLERLPPDHELFTAEVGYDIRRVRRRTSTGGNGVGVSKEVRTVEPYLEAVELDDRPVVIYSKYDISCALERQASLACEGYIPEDATRLGINIVLYAMLRDFPEPPADDSSP